MNVILTPMTPEFKFNRIFFVFLFLVSASTVAFSQNQPDTTLPYQIKHFDNPLLNKKYSTPLYMVTPDVFTEEVVYDPISGNFVISQKVGNITVGRPYVMSFEEYNLYRTSSIISNNWKLNNKTLSQDDAFLSNFLNPQIKLDVQGMDKVLGSDEITVVPTGNVDISLGVSYYNIDNPALSKTQRTNYNFDFTQDIQLGVNGKVGDKINVGVNFNTDAMFDFENNRKIEYNGEEDEIIQKIELGDVTFPINNTLITGSSTLFGARVDLQFGKLSMTNVLSYQKGETKTIEIEGGAVLSDFEISASDYDENKHFFLSHYFRDHYDEAMKNLPVITSDVVITKIEVWVTNKTSDFENARDIVGFMDLGEGKGNIYSTSNVHATSNIEYTDNGTNDLYNTLLNSYSGIRSISSASNILSGSNFSEGIDYSKLESARKLSESEYTLNSQLGYISLNYRLKPGEILAVAYEYTAKGHTYQVGEFSTDLESPNALILKLLRGPASVTDLPTWDLMMKNIYSLNTYSLSSDDFTLEVYYNNDKLGTKTNYIPDGDISNQRLLKVFSFDNADQQNNANPDGYFDFIEGITVNTKYGLIIFPELEPFGDYLADKIGDKQIADNYSFTELYDSTQYIAQQKAVKNKFYISGQYKSSGGNEVMLNVFNVPEGSVKVTQGGNELTEGTDYTVDYNIGKVTIINESLLYSGLPIKITLESNDQFGLTTKSLIGTHLNYQFSDNFNIGGTVLHLSELPVDLKTTYGIEPISNTIYGFNTSFSHEVPFLTKLVDFLPFIETKAPSTVSITGEFAQLIPGNPRLLRKQFDTDGVSFIDDFEQSQTFIDLKSPQAWTISSVPQGQTDLFPEASDGTGLTSGYNRAKIAWYSISDDIASEKATLKPAYITNDDISNHFVRVIYEKEIFPNKQSSTGLATRTTVLNLAYYPSEKGPYNYDVEGEPGVSEGVDAQGNLNDPESRWGGIMRDLYITDFESSNIGFIEFWILDPFIYDSTGTGGDLYINLGDISEDILKDSRKSRENGIPYPANASLIDTTQWGIVSRAPMTSQSFSNDANARIVQDVGLDGFGGSNEGNFFYDYLQRISQLYGVNSIAYQDAVSDPSNDNFRYYVGDYYDSLQADILTRYKDFNGMEGNSTESDNEDLGAVTQYPDMEDVNRDNTLDNYEAYYQYKIHFSPDQMNVGENYIVNKVQTYALSLPNDDKNQLVTWYQIKVPVHSPDKIVGQVQGFKSIRFIRLFMKGFSDPTILRLARFNLIKDEWREYQYSITDGGEATTSPQTANNGSLDISVVNIEESTQKEPVNYIMPPGVVRQQDLYQQQIVKQNEQSMSLKVIDLPDGEAKAVYKNFDIDLRQYGNLEMYVHCEALVGEENLLNDYDLTLFVRIGSDYTQNYYEYEIPLVKTKAGLYYSADDDVVAADRYVVWPDSNKLSLSLETLLDVKLQRNAAMANSSTNVTYSTPYVVYDGKNSIKVVGNPNLANVKGLMIGIRNPRKENNLLTNDDGSTKSAEIWVNELRLTDFNSDGGWAANTTVNANLADFGNVSFSGYMHTPGFGSIEKRVSERYMDQTIEYDFTSQFQLGKFFPKDYGVSIPVYYGFSQSYSTPEYNPFDPDIKFADALSVLPDSAKSVLKNAAQTFTQRRSFNITNINIKGKQDGKASGLRNSATDLRGGNSGGRGGNTSGRGGKKSSKITPPWKISNFAASVAFNEVYTRSPLIEFNLQQNLMYSLNYNYSPVTKAVNPFKKVKFLNKKAFQIIKDFNFYYLPTRVNFSTEVNRQYVTFRNRDVSDADIQLETSYQKNFLWNRNYDVSYKITNGLRLDFNATNAARIEPDGWVERETLFEQWNIVHPSDTVFLNLYDLGRNTDYTQEIKVNYRVPINKLPLLRWTTLTANYTANYDWLRGQDEYLVAATDSTDAYTLNFGNTVQNSSTLRLEARLNFSSLYKSVKYLNDVSTRFTPKGRVPVKRDDKDVNYKGTARLYKDTPKYISHNLKTENITKLELITSDGVSLGSKAFTVEGPNRIRFTPDTTLQNVTVVIAGKKKMNENVFVIASDYTLKTLMMLQNASFTYKKSGGSLINGFMPEAIIFGGQNVNEQFAPGWGFLAGIQDYSVIQNFADYGWLTTDSLFNLPMDFTSNDEVRARLSLEPFNNVKVDLNFQRNITLDKTVYGQVDASGFTTGTQLMNGNFYISINTIKSAFETLNPGKDSSYSSAYYDDFLSNRIIIAQRYAADRHSLYNGYDNNYTHTDSLTGEEYPDGYSSISQDVLVASFLAAYSGISPDKVSLNSFLNIPLPDWRVTFDGLSNLPFIKEHVKKLSLTHAYMSTYTINSFASNSNFSFDTLDLYGYSNARYETSDLFIPQYEFSGVLISEKFVPFVGIDITWNGTLSTRFEYKKARELYLSFSNNQIRERRTNGYTIGAGYTFKEMGMNIKVNGQPQHIKSDLNLRLDITASNDIEIYRKIVENFADISTQRNSFTLSFTADYAINEKLNLQFYFNDSVVATNTTARTTNAQGGFKVRFALTP